MKHFCFFRFFRAGLLLVFLVGIYQLAVFKHAEREAFRQADVKLTPGCEQKLGKYALMAGTHYSSPYIKRRTGETILRTGYSQEDVRAIQRGCNIIDDTQGQDAESSLERWNATRYMRGSHASCDHCHQGIGDKQNAQGDRLVGSLSLGASWSNGGDTYDRFTSLLLPFELRQMQCFINSSNGYKPNIVDDALRDITAYSRFLSGVLNLETQRRYPEQGIDEIPASATLRRGDDYVRGAFLFKQKCAHCHGEDGRGTVVDGRVIYPAVAGPNSFTRASRNFFPNVPSILPGFICSNMPLGAEGTLENQDCRDIAYHISNLPRPASDKAGPVDAAWQQLMMMTLPKLVRYFDNES